MKFIGLYTYNYLNIEKYSVLRTSTVIDLTSLSALLLFLPKLV